MNKPIWYLPAWRKLGGAPRHVSTLFGKHALGRSFLPRPIVRGLIVLLFSAAVFAQEPDGYVGAEVCASCHDSQFQGQSRSGHARTLHRAPDHPLAARFSPGEPLRRDPNFRFRFQKEDTGLSVLADDGEFVMNLSVEWAFGAGDHGVTFASRLDDKRYIEHAFSYYADTDGLDLTTGHEKEKPSTLHQAMGIAYTTETAGRTIRACFQCHSTGGVSFSEAGEVRVAEKGVRCEVCHGPGGRHADSVSRGEIELAKRQIRNPKRLTAAGMNDFCGTCHRALRDDGPAFDFNLAWNARHQPPYLSRSECFLKSEGKLSCITCHNPHEKVRRNEPDFYRPKCLGCHEGSAVEPSEVCQAGRAPDCTNCHMPEVRVSVHLSFKNHWIGIYNEASRLIPGKEAE